jgi:hypothetical protein
MIEQCVDGVIGTEVINFGEIGRFDLIVFGEREGVGVYFVAAAENKSNGNFAEGSCFAEEAEEVAFPGFIEECGVVAFEDDGGRGAGDL